jgi:hypothetical protein
MMKRVARTPLPGFERLGTRAFAANHLSQPSVRPSPRRISSIMGRLKAGAKLIAVDPRRKCHGDKASVFLQIALGAV